MLQSVLDGRVRQKLGRKASPAGRFGQGLLDALAGAGEGFSGYCWLATQAMLQAALEHEAAEFLGRWSYLRRADDQAAHRNGYERRWVATGQGTLELHVPQTRDGCEPFQTRILVAYRRPSEALEALIPQLYVKGLSVRDVSDAFAAVSEDAGVSAGTAGWIGQTLQEDFATWPTRSLAGYSVLQLSVGGMHLKLHPERQEKQPVLIAYGILWDGRKVLLHVGTGDRESYEACLGFLRDMTERGLRPPLLYCSNECPGLRKALRAVWPKSLPQKCQAHKLRNVQAKLPCGVQVELKRQIHAVFYAKDYQTRPKKGRALIEQHQDRHPQAMFPAASAQARRAMSHLGLRNRGGLPYRHDTAVQTSVISVANWRHGYDGRRCGKTVSRCDLSARYPRRSAKTAGVGPGRHQRAGFPIPADAAEREPAESHLPPSAADPPRIGAWVDTRRP